MSPAGLERAMAALKPGDHLCLIYETELEQVAGVIPYLQDGLARHERCLYIVDDRAVDRAAAWLRLGGLRVETALA